MRMRDTLVHRGPDDAGLWVSPDGTVGLGHRRLSVLDLSSAGHQPMCDPSNRVWVVYNGETYNFRELRNELIARGYSFRSHTDTEVLLYAYLSWGIDFVEKLEGMFAFALHDTAEGVTYLVRDRLGIKPLCYACCGDRLLFGSEIRAVLAAGVVSRELSAAAAYDFFTYGYVPAPATIYKGILKLPPAHILCFRGGKGVIRRYWQVQFDRLGDSSQTAAARVQESVDKAVEDYLVADVPTGAYLSGGLDSSVVTHRAAEVFARPAAGLLRLGGSVFHTFSIGFDVEEHSELPFTRLAAKTYGTAHTEQIVTREMAHKANDVVIDLFDEPFAASSNIPMMFVAALARSRVTVALCGEGGDEVFGGYNWYRTWLEFHRPSFWRTSLGRRLCRGVEKLTGHRKRTWRLRALDSVDLYAGLMGAVSAQDKRRIFAPELVAHLADRDEAAYFRQFWRAELPPMARMQYLDLMTFLPDLNLTRADRTSMHVSLELRVPLLNHRLVEYVCGLRQSVRNPDGQLKGLFKQAFSERLPEAIRRRRKKGFSAPVKQWFAPADLVRLVQAVCAERPELARSWLHPHLERFAGEVTGSRAYKLWVMLRWLQKHA